MGAFVVYQGHHGDRGAQYADIVLPGASREDWKIVRAASEYLGAELPYDDVEALRDRMEEISPALRRYDLVEPASLPSLSQVQLVEQNKGAQTTGQALKNPIENFFFTDAISRNSPTMARCSAAKAQKNPKTNFMAPGYPDPQVNYGPTEGQLTASA